MSAEEGRDLAKAHGMLFLEVSALDNRNHCVEEALASLLTSIMERLREPGSGDKLVMLKQSNDVPISLKQTAPVGSDPKKCC